MNEVLGAIIPCSYKRLWTASRAGVASNPNRNGLNVVAPAPPRAKHGAVMAVVPALLSSQRGGRVVVPAPVQAERGGRVLVPAPARAERGGLVVGVQPLRCSKIGFGHFPYRG